jgi:hypothetical protein
MNLQKLIIVADLGLLRAYREVQGLTDRQPHLELVAEWATATDTERPSESPGRFPRGNGAGSHVPGDLSAGERQHLEAELSRRHLGQLAEQINGLVSQATVGSARLAASPPIHKQLLNALHPQVRTKIRSVLASNLTRTHPGELPEHFARASA